MKNIKYVLLLVFLAFSGNLFSQVVLPESIKVEDGKPVMVMLTASWCGPCKIAKEKVLTDKAVQQELLRFENIIIENAVRAGKGCKSRAEGARGGFGAEKGVISRAEGECGCAANKKNL